VRFIRPRALIYATALVALVIGNDALVHNFGINGRGSRSLAAVENGAALGSFGEALIFLCLASVVFIFTRSRRTAIQTLSAWGGGLAAGTFVTVGVAMVALLALSPVYQNAANAVPDIVVYVIAKAAAFAGVVVMLSSGMLPEGEATD